VSAFAGTWRLVRLALRRDRILLPVWLASLAGLTAVTVGSVTALYTSEAERIAAASFTAINPVARIFDGPASGTELGALAMVEAYGVLAVLVALMSSQAVVRHTRADEEAGRAELLGSAVVGREAKLTAALVVTVIANLLLAVLVSATLLANDLPLAGSVASGAALAGVGIVFAGIAAVAAQVAEAGRGANGIAAAALGVVFGLRAIGDVMGEVAPSQVELISAWPSWVSPIGWGQQLRPFHEDSWWILTLYAGLFAVLVALAFRLSSRRDLGAGLLQVRPGPAYAGRGLRSALGLAWRMQWKVLLSWTLGIGVLAVAFGYVGDTVEELLTLSDELALVFAQLAGGGDIIDVYFAVLMGLLGVAAAGYTVQSLLRSRAEESAGRLEPVLATGVTRHGWLLGGIAIAAFGTTAILVTAGVLAGLSYGAVTGELAEGLTGFGGAALVQLPATFALGGFVVAAFALLPRFAVGLSWAGLAASLVMGQLGALLELPQAVMNASPFTHVPAFPAQELTLAPMAGLLGAALLLAVVGLVGFRRRDLAV
jgi:ABC-2 type transport system permease protein